MSRIPNFWRNETTGKLAPAVSAYLEGHQMSPAEIAAMRAYLRQWVGATIWDENPHDDDAAKIWLAAMRFRIDDLTTQAAIKRWIDDAVEGGIDPL